jgi:hypothetical protein
MSGKRARLAAWVLTVAVLVGLVGVAPAGAAPAPAAAGQGLRRVGTADVRALARDASAARLQAATVSGPELRAPRPRKASKADTSSPRLPVPNPANVPILPGRGGARGFDGISHADQRLAYDGNQYSKEPPDGATCQGNGGAVEMVNSALQFYTGDGVLVSPPLAANEFWQLPPEIDRTTDPVSFPGPSMADPRCTFDVGSGRMFLIFWATGQDPVSGAFTGQNTFYIAVSETTDPLGAYLLYALDVSAPGTPGCETFCLADFPTAATDANTYVLSYNEFGLVGEEFQFNTSKLVILSKAALAAGTGGPVELRDAPEVGGVPPFAIQGGIVPPGGGYETARGGTLWMVSSRDFDETGADTLGLLALVNTSAIDADPSAIRIRTAVVDGVLPHRNPPKARQREGPRPLGESEEVGEPLPVLDSGDTRTQPTKFAAGHLWTVIDTQVGMGDRARAGLLHLRVDPRFRPGGGIAGRVVHQGYVAVRGQDLTYGDVAVTPDGRRAVLVASLSGPAHYPSAVFGRLVPGLGVFGLHVYRRGVAPEDGFTCYAAFVGDTSRGCRWGDYSEANLGTDGRFYFETEYITPRLRTELANWGTAIGVVPARP